MIVAAIDIGTNNIRLLVVERRSDQSLRVLDSASYAVRLGEGLTRATDLAPAAMDRARSAVRDTLHRLQHWQPVRVRAVATEACRRAANAPQFLQELSAELGVPVSIISPAEEARLAALGCAPLLLAQPPQALIFDIGGGSTEFAFVRVPTAGQFQLLAYYSVPFGVVNVMEQLDGDPPTPACWQALRDRVVTALLPFEEQYQIAAFAEQGALQLLGCAGTVTTVAAVHRALPRYQRRIIDGLTMPMPAVMEICSRLAELQHAARLKVPGLGSDRADLIVAGGAILQAIGLLWPNPTLRVADRGLREGMVSELLS